MHCRECQEIMHRFIDGKVDSQTRKEVGLHIAECSECCQLIEGDKFWDDAVLKYLDHEVPADLKAKILGDADGNVVEDAQVSWRSKMKFIFLMATKKPSLRDLLETAALIAGIWLFIKIFPWLIGLIS